jgi:hypothetical protein
MQEGWRQRERRRAGLDGQRPPDDPRSQPVARTTPPIAPSPLPGPDADDGPQAVHEVGALGPALAPALYEACGDRLGEITWFTRAWQRSGAATGHTHWRLPDGSVIDAIAKVPVGYREYYWSTKLGETDPMLWDAPEAEHLPVPRVLASGVELGGHDVGWVIVEKIEGEPLRKQIGPDADDDEAREALVRLFDAAARFHRLAEEVRPPQPTDRPTPRNWTKLLEQSERVLRDNNHPDTARWGELIERTRTALDGLLAIWNARLVETWCHGDLHPGNVLSRTCNSCRLGADGGSDGPPGCQESVLIDLALMHAGHWVQDALYLERLHWGREGLLRGVNPVVELAKARSAQGLANGTDAEALADVRRVLMAATSPAFRDQASDEVYLAGALSRLEDAARVGRI